MSRNEITLQEMFSSVIRTQESGRWGRHTSAVNGEWNYKRSAIITQCMCKLSQLRT